ncbi:Pre-mRNA-splicing factor Cwf15/Cwc15 [Scheffersomyces xylosifermentans]|uniref:Pre-mRNA-splicing factor Cwf15/Cwc15 n=1 Tax=Scheffersomyces xylosifermentans TaxID=1304137 RepID=UPI00315DF93E
MTTNHRPTLESKRGKVQAIGDTIAHARALPQQTKLKYRQDVPDGKNIDYKTGKKAVEELKRELLASEESSVEGSKRRFQVEQEESIKFQENKRIRSQKEVDEETSEIQSKNKDHSEEDEVVNDEEEGDEDDDDNDDNDEDEDEDDEGSEEESDIDSEEETKQLLAELAKIKQERQAEKDKVEQEERKKKALSSNPLVQVKDAESSNEETNGFKAKKSWRSTTAFSNKPNKAKTDEESYTNDTLKSDYHQKFLSKYVR